MKNKRNKKIAFVAWFFPKLSETFVLNQITNLIDRGNKVSIFALKDPRKDLAKEDSKLEGVVHEEVKEYDLEQVTTYGNTEDLREEINSGDFDVIYFQFPDLAMRFYKQGPLFAPNVVCFHNISKKFKENEQEDIEMVFKRANVVLAISEFTKKELISLGCPTNKIILHHMGIDLERFTPRVAEKSGTLDFKFSIVGRMVEKKGMIYTLRAFRKLVKKTSSNKNLHLNIVGDGKLRTKVEAEIEKLDLQNHVHLYGKVPRRKVIEILQQRTDVLVCPSVESRTGQKEGLPVVTLEALALENPIIGTKHAAIPEIIEEDFGLLVEERSVDQLAAAMKEILNNYSSFQEGAKEGRKKVKENYNIKLLAEKLERIFEKAIKRSKLDKTLKKTRKNFKKAFEVKDLSVLLVGSVARDVLLNRKSDIDLVIIGYGGKMNPEAISRINNCLFPLKKETEVKLSPQIFAIDDFFKLVSSTLMESYLRDGELLFGKKVQEKINSHLQELSRFDLKLSMLKRIMFERYLARNRAALNYNDSETCYFLAKVVLFVVRGIFYIELGETFKTKRELVEKAEKEIDSPVPQQAFSLLKRNGEEASNDLKRRLISFIEEGVEKTLTSLRGQFPEREISIPKF